MIRFTQYLSKEDYRRAAAISLRTYKITKLRPWLILLLLVLGVFLIAMRENWAFGVFCIAYAIFMGFGKRKVINRTANSAASAKQFGSEIEVEIDKDGMFRWKQDSSQGEFLCLVSPVM